MLLSIKITGMFQCIFYIFFYIFIMFILNIFQNRKCIFSLRLPKYSHPQRHLQAKSRGTPLCLFPKISPDLEAANHSGQSQNHRLSFSQIFNLSKLFLSLYHLTRNNTRFCSSSNTSS